MKAATCLHMNAQQDSSKKRIEGSHTRRRQMNSVAKSAQSAMSKLKRQEKGLGVEYVPHTYRTTKRRLERICRKRKRALISGRRATHLMALAALCQEVPCMRTHVKQESEHTDKFQPIPQWHSEIRPESLASSIESKTSCRSESSCHGSSLNVADLAALVTSMLLLSLGLGAAEGESCDLPLSKASTCVLGFPL